MPCPSCRCNSGSIVFLLVEVVAILFTGATSKDTTNPFTSLDCPSPPPSASPSPRSSAINITFQSNVLALLDDLPSAAGPTGFASLSRGEGADRAFVRGMCRGDSTPDDCATYLRSAVLDINGHCNSNRRAAIWYDKCFLSYADTNASTAYENSYHAELYNVNNVTDKVGFERTYYALMSRLRARAANDTVRMFAAGEAVYDPGADNGTMYGLVQCMRDRTAAECDRCLNDSVQQLPSCCWGHQGGVVLGYNCYVRVEIYTYYDLTVDAQPPSPGPSASSSKPSIGEGQGNPRQLTKAPSVQAARVATVLGGGVVKRRLHRRSGLSGRAAWPKRRRRRGASGNSPAPSSPRRRRNAPAQPSPYPPRQRWMLDDDELGPSRQRRMLDGGGHGAQSEADLDPLFLCAVAASIFFVEFARDLIFLVDDERRRGHPRKGRRRPEPRRRLRLSCGAGMSGGPSGDGAARSALGVGVGRRAERPC
uniref:Gnk2-homologous domain-containing protein n=1 Tax=Oryza glumipatula TaxID=40148 RepID=A0A0D9ZHE6_9ORYZ